MKITMGELTKLIVCCLVIISSLILGVTGKVNEAATVGMIMGALGYVFGNGHGVLSAQRASTSLDGGGK